MAMTNAVKTLVDALTVDPASTETDLSNHASHHDVIHTALQELYIKRYEGRCYITGGTFTIATAALNTTGTTLTGVETSTGVYTLTFSSSFIVANTGNIKAFNRMTTFASMSVSRSDGDIIVVRSFDADGAAVDCTDFWLSVEQFA